MAMTRHLRTRRMRAPGIPSRWKLPVRSGMWLAVMLVAGSLRGAWAAPITFVFDVSPPDAEVRVNVNGRVPADRVTPGQPYVADAPQRLDVHATRPGWAPCDEVVKVFPPPAADGRVHVAIRMSPATAGAWGARHAVGLVALGALFSLAAIAWRRRVARERRRLAHGRQVQALQAAGDDPFAGRRIGRWRLVRRIGAGGMGSVYLAWPDDTLDAAEAVAIKLLDEAVADDPTFRQRFEHEIQACMKVSHPNVMRLVDWGNEDGRLLYLVAEYLQGEPLRARIVEGGMPADAALAYLRPLMTGLAHAHERGLVHRDVKPENVMVTDDGQVKIMDFGLARVPARDVTASGLIVGTPGYMAPEQIRAQAVDARADQYAVGIIAFELLGGRSPFEAADAMQLLYRHVDEQPLPSVRDVQPSVPEPVAAVVARMVEKDPRRRYPSLTVALKALEMACAT